MSTNPIERHRTFIKSTELHGRELQHHQQQLQYQRNSNSNLNRPTSNLQFGLIDDTSLKANDNDNVEDNEQQKQFTNTNNNNSDSHSGLNRTFRRSGGGSGGGGSSGTMNSRRDINDNSKTKIEQQPPICNRFGFILDDNGDKSNFTINKNFEDDGLGTDKQSRELAIAKNLEREKKWLEMVSKWDKYITSKKFEHIRKRCRKGIPTAVRGKAWFYLCGGQISLAKYPKFYEKLERQPGDEQVNDEIRKDIHRQFPNHELFREANGPGQQSLFNVLKCFSIIRKEISYCQGLGPVASILLMNMPPSHAFWSLVAIADNYVPGYYLAGFQAVQLHGRMLFGLLKKYSPTAYRILKKGEIDPVLYMFEWFMCLMVRNLPWPTVLRIWDMFLCEGIVIIFKAAIVMIDSTLNSDHKKMDQHDVLNLIKHPPEKELQESVFIPKVLNLNLTDKHLRQEHRKQLRKRAKNK